MKRWQRSVCDLHPTRCALVTAVTSQLSLARQRAVSRHSVTRFSPPKAKISSYKFQVSSYLLQHCVVLSAAEWPPNVPSFPRVPVSLPVLAQFIIRDRVDPSASVCLFARGQHNQSLSSSGAVQTGLRLRGARFALSREDRGTEGWCSKVSCSLLFAAMRLLRKDRNSQEKFPRFSAKISPQFTSQVVGLWLHFCFADQADLWFRVQRLIKRNNLKITLKPLLPMLVVPSLWKMEHFVIVLKITKFSLSKRSRFLSDCRLKMITHNYSIMLSALSILCQPSEKSVCLRVRVYVLVLPTLTQPFAFETLRNSQG